MDEKIKEKVRLKFIKYLANSHRGALTDAAKAIGCDRAYLGAWRSKKRPMSDHLVTLLAKHIAKDGFIVDDFDYQGSFAGIVFETPSSLADPLKRIRDAALAIAEIATPGAPVNESLDKIAVEMRYIADKIPHLRAAEEPAKYEAKKKPAS